ncbi:hypothetical protein TrispH2_005485 [Trichoplax sp. H2]|nr:hypothetical protein TrispH2_005485 [Trichoplax sp. H2]|eukprot:RDD42494.1 hypothetical protein TrispH2_005485 [Trichoplax sp. H2]
MRLQLYSSKKIRSIELSLGQADRERNWLLDDMQNLVTLSKQIYHHDRSLNALLDTNLLLPCSQESETDVKIQNPTVTARIITYLDVLSNKNAALPLDSSVWKCLSKCFKWKIILLGLTKLRRHDEKPASSENIYDQCCQIIDSLQYNYFQYLYQQRKNFDGSVNLFQEESHSYIHRMADRKLFNKFARSLVPFRDPICASNSVSISSSTMISQPMATTAQDIFNQVRASTLNVATAKHRYTTETLYLSKLHAKRDIRTTHRNIDELYSDQHDSKIVHALPSTTHQLEKVNVELISANRLQKSNPLNQQQIEKSQPIFKVIYDEQEANINSSEAFTSTFWDFRSTIMDMSDYDIPMEMIEIATKFELISDHYNTYSISNSLDYSSVRRTTETIVDRTAVLQTTLLSEYYFTGESSTSVLKTSVLSTNPVIMSTAEVVTTLFSDAITVSQLSLTPAISSSSTLSITSSQSTPSMDTSLQYPQFIISFGHDCGSVYQTIFKFAISVKQALSKLLQVPILSLTVQEARCNPFEVIITGSVYNYGQVIDMSNKLNYEIQHHGLIVLYNQANYTALNASVTWYSSVFTPNIPETTSPPTTNLVPLAITLGSLGVICLVGVIVFCLRVNIKLSTICRCLNLSHRRKNASPFGGESDNPLQNFTSIVSSSRINKNFEEMDEISEIEPLHSNVNIPKTIITSPSLHVFVDPILEDSAEEEAGANITRM